MLNRHQELAGNPRPARIALAVVVVTYNSGDVLAGLLDSIPLGLDGISHVVIVVDNDSRDSSVAIARAHTACSQVIETGRNDGYAAGINAACRAIGRETAILILNPDVRLMPGMGVHLMNALSNKDIGVAVPRVVDESGQLMKSARREPSLRSTWSDAILGTRLAGKLGLGEVVYSSALYRSGGSIDWATGAALLISPRARQAAGEWDETFFLYSEEVDYLDRVRRASLVVCYVAESVAVHIGGAYHTNPRLSAIMTANRIRYYSRRHGVLATLAYRSAIFIGEMLRWPLGPGHRAAALAAFKLPDVWALARWTT